MHDRSALIVDEAADRAPLSRTLEAAGLPVTGRFMRKAGWVSRAWIGDEFVVRVCNGSARDAYRHEAAVVGLLAGSAVPHARHIADGEGLDGSWYVSERLAGRTMHDAWPGADSHTRRAMVESLGAALKALHRVPVSADLLPGWLVSALDGGPWPAYHPPVVGAALQQVEAARRRHGADSRLLTNVGKWMHDRFELFAGDTHVLVHGDLHGSNVIVDNGQVTGLIDFAESLAQPADVELDTILRWCARARDFPPTPDDRGLGGSTLAELPGWLRTAYPELFEREPLRERLNFYDMCVELAIYAHHPSPDTRRTARRRIGRLLAGHNHLDRLVW